MWEHDEIYVAIQREREEIVGDLEGERHSCRDAYDMGLLWAIGRIKARGEKKPGKIEKDMILPRIAYSAADWSIVVMLSQLIDAVNEMRNNR